MQTFLPYADFAMSAKVLDRQRLGKQRVETLQVMTVLCGGLTAKGLPYKGWDSHPAVKMWRGYEAKLLEYQNATVREWLRRGYKDTCWDKTEAAWIVGGRPGLDRTDVESWGGTVVTTFESVVQPPWLGDPALHESHRSNLLRKDFLFYELKFPGTPLGLDYVWPVS